MGVAVALLVAGLLVSDRRDVQAQQTGTVTGEVTDAQTEQPVTGVQVTVQELALGTVTDGTGSFELENVPSGTHVLEFQILGYAPVEEEVIVVADETVSVEVSLQSRAIEVDEIVATGLGVVEERRRIGQTVSTVSSEELRDASAMSMEEALQGRVAGMQLSPAGEVGASSPIQLRTPASLSMRNDPIIYIDGVRMDNTHTQVAAVTTSPLDHLNPRDIERVEVIKGAAAATLYGTEASSGVIQITTRQGVGGDPQWSLDTGLGWNWMDPDDVPASHQYVPEDGAIATVHPAQDYIGGGRTMEHNLSVRGGFDRVQYSASTRYVNQHGALPRNTRENMSVRSGLDVEFTQNLNVSANLNLIRNDVLSGHNPAAWGQLGAFTLNDPTVSTELRPYGGTFQGVRGSLNYRNNQVTDNFTVSGTVHYDWRDNLRSQATVGYNQVDENQVAAVPPGVHQRALEGERSVADHERTSTTLEFSTTWSHDITPDITSSFAFGGQSFWEDEWYRTSGVRDFPAPGLATFRGAAEITHVDEFTEEVINAGVFVQEQVGFQDRLFLTAGLRMDGNSAFGDDMGFQFYPKFGASWVVSDHDFWGGMDGRGFNHLRLRYAYGQAGLQPGAFDAVRTWTPVSVINNFSAVMPLNLGNPDLRPEVSVENEWAAEFELFDGTLGGEFVYFRQSTRDALLEAPEPPSAGFTQRQLTNLGELKAQGIEVSADIQAIRTPRFGWTLSPQLSWTDQEVADLGGVEPFRLTGGRRHNQIREGYTPGAILYRTVDPQDPYNLAADSYEDFTDLGQVSPNFLQDAAGEDSLVYHGQPNPSVQGSLRSRFDLPGNLSASVLLEGAAGFIMSNETALIREASRFTERRARFEQELADPNTSAERRREIAEAWGTKHPDDIYAWAEDGDYLRLQELRLAYDVPQSFAARLGLGSLRAALVGRNLYLFTGYSGLQDPGTSVIPGAFTSNVDYFMAPRPHRVGLQLQATW